MRPGPTTPGRDVPGGVPGSSWRGLIQGVVEGGGDRAPTTTLGRRPSAVGPRHDDDPEALRQSSRRLVALNPGACRPARLFDIDILPPCSSPVGPHGIPRPATSLATSRERGTTLSSNFPRKTHTMAQYVGNQFNDTDVDKLVRVNLAVGTEGGQVDERGTGIPLTIEIRSPDHPGPTPVVRGPAHLERLYSLVFVAMGTASGRLRRSFSEFDRLDDSDRADRRGARPMPSTPQAITRPHATRLAPRAPPVSFRRRSSSVVSTRTTRTRRTSSTRCVST